MTLKLVMTRLIYLNVLILFALLDGLLLSLEQNALNLLAAAAGALVIRFAWPQMPVKRSVAGFLTGVILACLFGNSLARQAGIATYLDTYTVWGCVALIADIFIQFIGWIIRFLQPMGTYAIEHPTQAVDNSLEVSSKVLTFWVRWKTPILDFIDEVRNRYKSPKP